MARDDQFFWNGLREGKLLVRVCDACGRGAFPPMPGCPHCGHDTGHVVESSGHANLYTWTVCHVAFDPAFAADVPYVVGVVELPEQARLIARIEGIAPDDLVAGMPLSATMPAAGGDDQPKLTFTPAAHGAGS
jgi:uncharacterized OB-fold protein